MSLFTKLFEAVHSWRRRRGGTKSRKRSDLAMEQLDHRQLLAVNFTGVVAIDFPATQTPGVVNRHTPDPIATTASDSPRPRRRRSSRDVITRLGFQIDQLRRRATIRPTTS